MIFLLGILAGMWPCGVITLLSELFVAEGKAQVYGHFHQFLQSAPATASNLSKLSSMCIFPHSKHSIQSTCAMMMAVTSEKFNMQPIPVAKT
jgi:hypothetical protein